MEQEILDLAVQEHNKYRKKLGARELVGDPTMHSDAQRYAEFLAASHRFEPTTMGKYGNQVAMSFQRSKADAIKDSISRWFGNKSSYRPFELHSTQVGVGIAWSDHENKWIVVAFYYPAAF